ncbi:MAG: hypothetical protein DHS20C08_15600 [Rhodomicrobium sp.]|nr:MAG: hypothetical protein DHS20C08_15600 [Rhodomicrobium sp.]
MNTDAPTVLLLHPSRTAKGGIVNAMFSYAKGLMAEGVGVFIWSGSEDVKQQAEALGIDCFTHKSLSNSIKPLFSASVLKEARRVKKYGKLHIVHQGGRAWFYSKILLPKAQHAVVFHNRKLGSRKKFKNWLAISSSHLSELNKMDMGRQRNVNLIRNGILEAHHLIKLNMHEKILQNKTITIGTLAEFRPEKRLCDLINATNILKDRGVNIRLYIGGAGGNGAEKALVERLGLEKEVVFLGWVTDKSSFLEKLDIFLLTSSEEPFGLVVIEAMHAGLPVISTACHGPKDIIEHGKSGWLIEIGSPDAMATQIETCVRDREATKKTALDGRESVTHRYSDSAVGKALVKSLALQ